jgi:hypothetical protein
MFKAFVTGFAKQTTEEIESRNKEIKDNIRLSMIDRAKKNEEIKSKASKEYSSRAEVARKASSLLSNLNVPANQRESYLIAFVENPDRFAQFEEAVTEGRTGVDSVGDFVVLPKDQPSDKAPTLDQVLGGFKPRTRAGAAPADYSETRTAFGLSGAGVARSAETEAAAALGMSEDERLGLEYETPKPQLDAKFNFNVLLKESADSIDRRIDKASRQVLDAETPEAKAKATAELERVLAVKSLQKKSEGGADKESDIRSNYRILSNTIMEAMAGPGELVRDPESGAFMYSRTARAEVRDRIEEQKRKAFETSDLTKSYRRSDGTLPPEVKRVMSSFLYTPPPAPATSSAAGSPASRAPTVQNAAAFEKEKADAYDAIAKGADTAAVKKQFKERTGRDLP